MITHSDPEISALTVMIRIKIIIHGVYVRSGTAKITSIYELNIETVDITVVRTKMAFILGVGSYSSDTRGPIWMKLWGYIELTLKLCIVIFSTSGLDVGTGNWYALL